MTSSQLQFARQWTSKLSLIAFSLVALSGCLDTRSDVQEQDEKQVLRKQVQTLQQTTAGVDSRFQDVDDEMRKLSGRIDALETKNQQSSQKVEKGNLAVDAKLKENDGVYREEFTKLKTEIESLKTQLAAIQDEQKRAAEAAAAARAVDAPAPAGKSSFTSAETKFESKNYKEAILDYERYRKANPKGKLFATATLKIGECFQELGLLDDAKAFYDEVIAKFPGTKDAAGATKKLKGMKKK